MLVAKTFEIDVNGGEYCMKNIMMRKVFGIIIAWNEYFGRNKIELYQWETIFDEENLKMNSLLLVFLELDVFHLCFH